MTTRIKDEAESQDARVAQGGAYRKFQHLIREEYPYFMDKIGNVENKKILTMGCSTGGVTPFARERAWTHGIDISQMAIVELAHIIVDEKLSSHASVSVMNCEALALKNKTFDIVLFFGVLHHLDIDYALSESFRVLKPGGKVYMCEPLGLHPVVNIYRKLTPHLRTKFEHPLKPRDFRIMKKYFRIEHFKGFCLTSVLSLVPLYLFKSDKLYEFTRRILMKFDDVLFRIIPPLHYFSWSAVVVLYKKRV